MRLNDILLGLLMAGIGVAVILHARGFPEMAGMQFGPDFFPILIGAGFALSGLALVVSGGLEATRGARSPWITPQPWMREPLALARAGSVIGAIVFYVLAVPYLGFLLTVFLTAFGLLLVMAVRPLLALVVAVILPVLLHYGFSVALRVPLPRGPIETWLM